MKNKRMLQIFSMMDTGQRYQFINNRGIHLISVVDDCRKCCLYACEDFFVEFRFFLSDPFTIVMVVFDDTHFLEPYLKEIDVTSLMKRGI